MHASDMSKTFPADTCPLCGKEFLRQPNWGCVVTVKGADNDAWVQNVKLCSIPCMREYERRLEREEALHAATLRCVRSYKLHIIDVKSIDETWHILGHNRREYVTADCNHAANMYWRQIEWLEEHDAWDMKTAV